MRSLSTLLAMVALLIAALPLFGEITIGSRKLSAHYLGREALQAYYEPEEGIFHCGTWPGAGTTELRFWRLKVGNRGYCLILEDENFGFPVTPESP